MLFMLFMQFIFIQRGWVGTQFRKGTFEIENSERILGNIMSDIDNRFKKQFQQSDSVYIFNLSSHCKVTRYGNAINEEKTFVIIK